MAAYAAALAGLPRIEIRASRTLPGTINALVVNYYGSDDWQKLAADTKKNRGRVIERFRAEHGNKRVALLQREHILGMLAAIERPSAKRHWLKAIRGLLRAAVPAMRRDDPTEGIAGIKMPKTKGQRRKVCCAPDNRIQGQNPTQMLLAKDQDVIQAVPPNRPDQALNIWVLPGRSR